MLKDSQKANEKSELLKKISSQLCLKIKESNSHLCIEL